MTEVGAKAGSWERMFRAVERVKERLRKATAALDAHGVPYAVIGGNAVANWVARIDETAVRTTQDVDLLVRRADLDRVKAALATAGFTYRHAAGIDFFLEASNPKPRNAVRVIFAEEKVRPEYEEPAPRVEESEAVEDYRVLLLDALVRMKLTSFRYERPHARPRL